jgi:phosphohistidine phosphatase
MKKLYLIRHAKSSWEEDGISDFDRPLKGRGVRDAHSTAQWLYKQGEFPEVIISSPATRAMHTALIFANNLKYPFRDIQIAGELYAGDSESIPTALANLDNKVKSVFLFGHNPSLTNYVNHCIDHIIDNVPTTGVACLKFDSKNWSKLGRQADLVFFDYPKRHRQT